MPRCRHPRPAALLVALVAVAAAGCGGAPSADSAPAGTTIPVAPTVDAATPDDLAMVDPTLALDGPVAVEVRPGESLRVDQVLRRIEGGTATITIAVRELDETLVAAMEPASVRLDTQQSMGISATVTVPDDAEIGSTLGFDLVAVAGADPEDRVRRTVELTVVDRGGDRPVAGDDRAETTTDAQVVVYVVGNDSDADGDLDVASLSIVDAGARGANVEARSDGTIVYEPFANVTGRDTVLYRICDRAGSCDTAALTIDVG